MNAVVKASSQGGRTADIQISNAIGAMARRSGIVWADYSTNQTWAACPTWGTQNITLALYPVTYTIATNCTIPSNVTLQFSHGSCLAPADGTTTTIKGYFTAPMSKIFCNAVPGEGAVRLATVNSSDEGGQALVDVYPEWWGATASDATGATNTPAIQAAIIGAYGNNRTNSTAYPKYNRVLHLSTLYNIDAELRVYHMIGFRWEGENQFGSGLRQRTCGLRIIDGQSVAYGRFESLRFENGCGGKSGAALVDIDYNGAQGADLRPQNITFYDDFFAGGSMTDVGVLIAKSGGGAQGDNIRCYNCYFNGFTGRVGRSVATTLAAMPDAVMPRTRLKNRSLAETFKDVHCMEWQFTAEVLRWMEPRWRTIPPVSARRPDSMCTARLRKIAASCVAFARKATNSRQAVQF